MKNLETIIKQILSTLSINEEIPPEKICPTDSLLLDLNMDSLAIIELLIAIEEEVGVSISDEDLLDHEEWSQTVGSLVKFVKTKID